MATCFILIAFLISLLATIPVAAVLGEPTAFTIAILMTVFVGIELRLGTEIVRRYKNYRAKDKIRN